MKHRGKQVPLNSNIRMVTAKWVMETHNEEMGFGWETLVETWLDFVTDHLLLVEDQILKYGEIKVPVIGATCEQTMHKFVWDGHHRTAIAYIHDLPLPYIHIDGSALREASLYGYPSGHKREHLPQGYEET